jgi:hypothetical protein
MYQTKLFWEYFTYGAEDTREKLEKRMNEWFASMSDKFEDAPVITQSDEGSWHKLTVLYKLKQ